MLTSSLLLAAALPTVLAQSANVTFMAGLFGTLQTAGLTQLATFAQTINSSTLGQNILANISNGSPHILFAPNDAALGAVSSDVSGNADSLSDILSYHVIPGNFSGTVPTYPNTTLGRTLLVNGNFVQLEGGNKAQVLAWASRSDGRTHVLNQRNDTSVVNVTTFGNLTIWIVDHVLQIPQDLSLTIPADNVSLTGIDTLLRTVQTPLFNSSTNSTANITLFDALNTGFHGFTFFAPNSTAVQAAQANLTSMNSTQLQNLLYNHILNGTTNYSPVLANQEFTTAAGQTLSLSTNATGQYVNDRSSNTTARIVQPDVLLPNGVIHVIDRMFFDTNLNPSAASSAIASATSAATVAQGSQTVPIGFSQTSGLSSASASAGGNSSAASPSTTVAWGLLATALGLMAGAVFTFA